MSGILLGLGQLAQPTALLALLGGVVIGLIVGSLPGLNDSITMAVLIPITFGMEPQVAICLLVGIYCASACGGSVPSILLKIPGTASATVTAYDGYPMSQQGKSGQALGLAISSSTFGGLTSAIVLLFLSPFLAKQALKFGPPEYFMLAVLGMSTVIGMAGNNIAKNILAMAVGCTIHAVCVYSSVAAVVGHMSPVRFFRGMAEAMIIAFTTCSSAGTLPVNMKNTEEKLGVKRDIASFVLPLGATINMDGTALYMGVCSLFIANVFGIHLTMDQMMMIVLTGTLASIGTKKICMIFWE